MVVFDHMRPKLATTLTRLVAVATAAAVFAGVSPAFAGAADAPLDRENAIRRAKTWTTSKVRYSQTGYRDGYRRDCSGFISMAWSLPENLVTWRLPLVTKRVGKGDLQPGDILLNYTSAGGAKHAIIFERWANKERTAYIGLEQTGASGVDKAVRRKIPYPYWTNKGKYKPYRYVGMDGYWKRIPAKDRQPVRGYRGPIKSPEKLKAEAAAKAKAVAKKQAAEKAKALAAKKAAENAAKQAAELAAKPAAEKTAQQLASEAMAQAEPRKAAREAARALVSPHESRTATQRLDDAVIVAGTRTDALLVQVLGSLR